jgi:hypothetical protein
MTQRQRRARAQRAGARRRKVNAAVVAWRKMNPGKKLPAAVRVKRLTGGGFSVTPVKMNAGPFSLRKTKKRLKGLSRSSAPSARQKREIRAALGPGFKKRFSKGGPGLWRGGEY